MVFFTILHVLLNPWALWAQPDYSISYYHLLNTGRFQGIDPTLFPDPLSTDILHNLLIDSLSSTLPCLLIHARLHHPKARRFVCVFLTVIFPVPAREPGTRWHSINACNQAELRWRFLLLCSSNSSSSIKWLWCCLLHTSSRESKDERHVWSMWYEAWHSLPIL